MSGLASALADRYRIERELGGGGMSRVWVATETALGRQVVVKVIAAELAEGLSAERFTREVRLAARLQQANIVPLDTMRARSGDRLPATGAVASALEELGDHEAAVALLGEAIAKHDTWLVNFSRSQRFDKLRRDPRAAEMLARLEKM